MNERIKELATEVGISVDYLTNTKQIELIEKFAELIVRECVNALEFHGFDDAIPYIRWMATNKLGFKDVKE